MIQLQHTRISVCVYIHIHIHSVKIFLFHYYYRIYFLKIYFFIFIFRLWWVSVAACRLSLTVKSRGNSLAVVCGLLIRVASLAVEHGL